MLVERVANNQIIISFSSGTDVFGIQRLIDYAKYLEATSKSKAKQSDIDKLANEVNADWWIKNKLQLERILTAESKACEQSSKEVLNEFEMIDDYCRCVIL